VKIRTEISLLPEQPPSKTAWNQVCRFVAAWNERHVHRFQDVMGCFFTAVIPDKTVPALAELQHAVEALQAKHRFKVSTLESRVYDAADYAAADFVDILGVGLDHGGGRKLVLNQRQVLRASAPCPGCGSLDPFSQTQSGPFLIDEAVLDRPLPDGEPAPAGGWDLVNAPAGHKLVSARLVDVLEKGGVKGYTLEPVLASKQGRTRAEPSRRMWQLLAKRALVAPCSEHTRMREGYHCPSCGTALGDVDGDTFVSDESLGGDDIFAAHQNRAAVLNVRGRVYQLLTAAHLGRIIPNQVLRLCHHGSIRNTGAPSASG
jgi:hypothetical protein